MMFLVLDVARQRYTFIDPLPIFTNVDPYQFIMAARDEVEELSDLLESLPTRSREDKKVDEVEKNEDVSSKEQAKKKIWEK